MAEIREQRFPHKIKRHFQLYFGIPQESPEKLQLDQLMLKQDDCFDELEAKMNLKITAIKQEQKIIRYIAIAIGAVLGVPEVIRLFGFG